MCYLVLLGSGPGGSWAAIRDERERAPRPSRGDLGMGTRKPEAGTRDPEAWVAGSRSCCRPGAHREKEGHRILAPLLLASSQVPAPLHSHPVHIEASRKKWESPAPLPKSVESKSPSQFLSHASLPSAGRSPNHINNPFDQGQGAPMRLSFSHNKQRIAVCTRAKPSLKFPASVPWHQLGTRWLLPRFPCGHRHACAGDGHASPISDCFPSLACLSSSQQITTKAVPGWLCQVHLAMPLSCWRGSRSQGPV